MKQALVCVSFGTTLPKGRTDIIAVETALQRTAPERYFARAFTSGMIRKCLAAHREPVDGLSRSLDRLLEEKYTDVAVQPTHLLYGYEYDKIKAEISRYADRFFRLALGRPLLADANDLANVAGILDRAYPRRQGEILVLMGHGTEHFAGVVYPALQSTFTLQGIKDVLVATVEGWPGLDEILPQLQRSGCRRVHLAPLLLVAGDHACHDMAGSQPESWKNRLEAEGFSVRCTLEGLGRMPEIQQLYCNKLREILE